MFGFTTVELKNRQGKYFYYDSRKIEKKLKEVKELINRFRFLEKYSEPKREIREGIIGEYNDQTRENQRRAYQFVLAHPELTEDNLHTLYEILSVNQLDEDSELEEKRSYRKGGVYVINSSNPFLLAADMDKRIDPSLVPEYMRDLFKFINRKDIDPFIKSQIAHVNFVFVHPFYDINRRTARNLSLWILINDSKEPYTIIHRGIIFNKEGYLKSVGKSHKRDLTPYLVYSLDTLKKELQIQKKVFLFRKEKNLTAEECETLELLFRMQNTTLDGLIDMFNCQRGLNDRKIIINRLLRLLEKNVISYDEDTGEIRILDMKEKNVYRRVYGSR